MRNISLIFIFILFFGSFCCFAGEEGKCPTVRYSLLYQNDLRHSGENFIENRLDVLFEKQLEVKSLSLPAKVIPFLEVRQNYQRNINERVVLGTELGTSFLPWLYAAEELRYVWRYEKLYHGDQFVNTDMAEAVTHVVLSRELFNILDKDFTGYSGIEHTYDFRNGRATRIELILGISAPVSDNVTANIDWRHKDRIHYFDCDAIEGSITYNF